MVVDSVDTVEAPGHSRPRSILLLLFFICAAPVLLAWLLSNPAIGWRPANLANHGELIDPPRRLDTSSLAEFDGGRFGADRLLGKWSLLAIVDQYGERSAEMLRKMRYIQLALGKNVIRTQRILIVSKTVGRIDGHKGKWPFPIILQGALTVASLGHSQETASADTPSLFVVDPNGYLMMRYPKTVGFSDIVSDLRRLLSTSVRG